MISVRSVPGSALPVVDELPEPVVGRGEVIVGVRAAAINPADPFVLSGEAGRAFGLPDAVGLGYDVAGLHDDPSAPTRGQASK